MRDFKIAFQSSPRERSLFASIWVFSRRWDFDYFCVLGRALEGTPNHRYWWLYFLFFFFLSLNYTALPSDFMQIKLLSLVVYKSLPKESLTAVLGIHEKIVSSCKVVSVFGFTST